MNIKYEAAITELLKSLLGASTPENTTCHVVQLACSVAYAKNEHNELEVVTYADNVVRLCIETSLYKASFLLKARMLNNSLPDLPEDIYHCPLETVEYSWSQVDPTLYESTQNQFAGEAVCSIENVGDCDEFRELSVAKFVKHDPRAVLAIVVNILANNDTHTIPSKETIDSIESQIQEQGYVMVA